jgi:hypothetical protein
MKIRADSIRPGQRIDGAEVVWVLPVRRRDAVMVAVDMWLPLEGPGAATRIHTFRRDDWVDVDERRPGSVDRLQRG